MACNARQLAAYTLQHARMPVFIALQPDGKAGLNYGCNTFIVQSERGVRMEKAYALLSAEERKQIALRLRP